MEVKSLSNDDFFEMFSNLSSDAYDPNMRVNLTGHRAVFFAAYAVLLIVGSTANFAVAVIICRVLRAKKTEAPRSVQIYILALCCCDMLTLSFLPLLLLDLAYGRWTIPSRPLCKLYVISESVNKFGFSFLLVALSSFCYFTICGSGSNRATASYYCAILRHRLRYDITSPRFALALIVLCVCIVSLLVAPVYAYTDVHYVVVLNDSHVTKVLPKCLLQMPERYSHAFTLYSFIFGYATPAILVIFFYTSVIYFVRVQAKYTNLASERATPRVWHVAKTSMGLVGFYLVCWTPYWIMNLHYAFAPQQTTEGQRTYVGLLFSYFIHMLPTVNCCVMPILYTVLNGRIRADYSRAVAVSRDRRRRRRLLAMGDSKCSLYSTNSCASVTTNVVQCNSTTSDILQHPKVSELRSIIGRGSRYKRCAEPCSRGSKKLVRQLSEREQSGTYGSLTSSKKIDESANNRYGCAKKTRERRQPV